MLHKRIPFLKAIGLLLLLGMPSLLMAYSGPSDGELVFLLCGVGILVLLAGLSVVSFVRFLMLRSRQRKIYALLGAGYEILIGIGVLELDREVYFVLCLVLIQFLITVYVRVKVSPAIDNPPPSE